jgi:hypothetical protein
MIMKSVKKIIAALGILAACSFYISCSREIPGVAGFNADSSNAATIQVFSATVRAARNYIYVDGIPASGVALAYGGIFPATAYSIKVTPGLRLITIKDTLSTSTQTPINFSQQVALNKSYTIFTYDTVTAAKQLTVTNNIVIPTDTVAMLRFGNFIYNTTTVPAIDVYSFRKGAAAPVFSNVATTQVTDFIRYQSGISDTLYVYATGTTAPLLVKQLIPNLTPGRSYTSVYNGSFRGTKQVSTFVTF